MVLVFLQSKWAQTYLKLDACQMSILHTGIGLKDALHKSGVCMANLGRGANYKKDASHDGLCTAIIIDRYE